MNDSKRAAVFLLSGLAAANIAVFAAFRILSLRFPFLISLGFLAYIFGLRHAADADHIAAIDNTTRKLVNDKEKSLSVGLYFSLGHSTIVFLLSFGLAVAAGAVKKGLPNLEAAGGMAGTLISAAFLFVIAVFNLVILKDIYRVFGEMRRVKLTPEKIIEMEELLLKRGFMNRLLGKAYAAVRTERQMYPIGILFGLGFDTASEVALLGMSAFAAGKGMPVFAVLILPILFAAGMSLIDTLDGMLMQYAYSWAFLNPIRKVYYNLTVTAVSVLLALAVGSVELLQAAASKFHLRGFFWNFLLTLNFETMGYYIIALFAACWAVSAGVYKLKNYEKAAL